MMKHIIAFSLLFLLSFLLFFHHTNQELFIYETKTTEWGAFIESKPPIYYENQFLYYIYKYDYLVLLICVLVAIIVYFYRKKVNYLNTKNKNTLRV